MTNAHAFNQLGYALRKTGQFAKAIGAYHHPWVEDASAPNDDPIGHRDPGDKTAAFANDRMVTQDAPRSDSDAVAEFDVIAQYRKGPHVA